MSATRQTAPTTRTTSSFTRSFCTMKSRTGRPQISAATKNQRYSCSSTPVTLFHSGVPLTPSSVPYIVQACGRSLQRIITVKNTTITIAYKWPIGCFSIHFPRPVKRSMASITKKPMPQNTYVHAAPCHRPVSDQTMNMLNSSRHLLLTRLPPSGMYR